MICFAPSSSACNKPSAKTKRPSASVFTISTDKPFLYVITSPSLYAEPEIMFSAQHRIKRTRLFKPRIIAKPSAPVTVAAPPMSHFIVSMPSDGLIE